MERCAQSGDAQDADTRSRELDRERNAIEPPADLYNRRDVTVHEPERLALGHRTVDEQRHALLPVLRKARQQRVDARAELGFVAARPRCG